ncbi:MAG: hypothetical protein GY754_44900 [bacterium]|nr:hypothetical protein [bacterium]
MPGAKPKTRVYLSRDAETGLLFDRRFYFRRGLQRRTHILTIASIERRSHIFDRRVSDRRM